MMDVRMGGVEFVRKAFYSPREYAALAGVDPSTVMDYIHRGKLYAVKLSDRVYRVPLAAVISALYPHEIGEPRFRSSGEAADPVREDQHRWAAERKPGERGRVLLRKR